MDKGTANDIFAKTLSFTQDKDAEALLGEYPYFQRIQKHDGGTLVIGDRRFLATGSNDYLGLSQDPRVIEAAQQAAGEFGTSCTGSRLLTGTLSIHTEMEERMAEFLGREAVLVTSAGYLACLAALSAVGDKNDALYFDKDNHASLYDGALLSGGTLRRFRHGSMDGLERLLKRDAEQEGGKLIVVDGVFSMIGHIVDLPRVVELAEQYNARVMVDDAHALGVLGDGGRGTAYHFNLQDKVDLVVGTFSKSLASVGGYIAGPAAVINWIRHQARPFMFNAAGPASQVAAAMKALQIMQQEPERIDKLWRNTHQFHTGLTDAGLDIMGSQTPVVPVLTRTLEHTAIFWKGLWDAGVFATPSVPPGVPPGQCLIRASITASHSEDEIGQLIEIFQRVGKETGVI